MLFKWKKIFLNEKQEGDIAYVVPYYKDGDSIHVKHDGPLKVSVLIDFLRNSNAKGESGETMVLFTDVTVILVAIPKNSEKEGFFVSGASVYDEMKRYSIRNIKVEKFEGYGYLIMGVKIKSFSYDFLKAEKEASIFIEEDEEIKKFISISNYKNLARFLAETPANYMNPTLFSEYGIEILEDVKNVNVHVYTEKYIKEKGMNLFYSVAKGSEVPPKLMVIEYRGKEEKGVDLCLVGKGVTFDSGGISIKPAKNMKKMKADMMGAASVLAAIAYISSEKLPINCSAVIPLAENMPSGKASKPGDVFVAMNGITVEVEDTDAEGRLLLADALCLAQEMRPAYIIDIATLTGSIAVALSSIYAGAFTNSDDFWRIGEEASKNVFDPLWRMPLNKKYGNLLKSDGADFANCTPGVEGDAPIAASFLHQFVKDEEVKWMHIDVAGVSIGNHLKSVYGSYHTGKPVRLLMEIAELLSKK